MFMSNSKKMTLRHKEEKDGEVKRLKNIIRRLESDKRKLLSEIKTLEEAFGKNIQFLKGKTDGLTIGELLNAAKKEQSLEEIEDEKQQTFSDMEKKWKCFKCEVGLMKLLIYGNREGMQYLRKCSNPKCLNRTKPKPYNSNVEGLR
jgi:hypothetical protein